MVIYLFCLHSGPDAADLADSQNTVRLCLFFCMYVCGCFVVYAQKHFWEYVVSQPSCSVIDSSWFDVKCKNGYIQNEPFTLSNSFRGASSKIFFFFFPLTCNNYIYTQKFGFSKNSFKESNTLFIKDALN